MNQNRSNYYAALKGPRDAEVSHETKHALDELNSVYTVEDLQTLKHASRKRWR